MALDRFDKEHFDTDPFVNLFEPPRASHIPGALIWAAVAIAIAFGYVMLFGPWVNEMLAEWGR
jgi:hypothetical protein